MAIGIVNEEARKVFGVYELDEDFSHETPAVLEVGEHLFGVCERLNSLGSNVVNSTGRFFSGTRFGFDESF